ncbi:hypothetical protein KKG80_01835 [Patescibacteria group bacterium]|nr:hypothetical protein [Patescibacteria group bacterium]
MLENNLQKPLTLEDLGKFTEDVLLPAIEEMIDQKLEAKLEEKLEAKLEEKLESKLEEKLESKLEEKLSPIWQELRSIRQDLKRLEEKVDRIAKASSEDIIAVNTEVEKLKRRVTLVEKHVQNHAHVLQTN